MLESIIKYSQNLRDDTPINCTALLDKWRIQKEKFIHAFGDKTILEVASNVSFTLPKQEKNLIFQSFIENIEEEYPELAIYCCQQGMEAFFGNSSASGIKLVKSFKFFIDDADELRKIQDYASSLIQKNTLKGTLCLSVDPLDFLSMSENTYNWDTCQNLTGEYRAATLSYMCDDSTIIAYIKSDKDVVLPNFPKDIKWNNKKWRVLLHYGNNLIFAGRQYPFEISGLLEILREPLKNLINFNGHWSPWTTEIYDCVSIKNKDYKIVKNDRMLLIDNYACTLNSCITIDNPLVYNDLSIKKDDFKFSYSWREYKHKYLQHYPIQIGEKDINCPICGTPIFNSDFLICQQCEEIYKKKICANCGISENLTVVNDIGLSYCKDCAERLNIIDYREE